MSSQQSGEDEIRRKMIEADAIDCMVALPGQLFYSTQIPACLWFLARDKSTNGQRDRHGEILFIDARKLGVMVDRTRRELTSEDIERITGTYHQWRSKEGYSEYNDVPGFCKSATLEEVRKKGYVLTPSRFVGDTDEEDDGVPFEEKIEAYRAQLSRQFDESSTLSKQIEAVLTGAFA